MMPPPPRSTLFPYTTLFRSCRSARVVLAESVPVSGGLSPLLKKLAVRTRSEEHTSELQSRENLVCRRLLEKKNDLLGNSCDPINLIPTRHFGTFHPSVLLMG